MKLVYLPRPDRPCRPKVEALQALGVEVHLIRTEFSRDPNSIPKDFSQVLQATNPAPVLFEHAVISQARGVGAYKAAASIKVAWPKRKLILWSEEMRKEYGGQLSLALPYFDVVLMNHEDSDQQHILKQGGFRKKFGTMYGSADPGVFGTNEDLEKATPEFDVVFFGRVYSNSMFPLSRARKQLVQALQKHFKVGVAGNGWTDVENLVDDIKPNDAVAEFAKKGKIILGANQFNARRYYPERVWQSMAAARCVAYWLVPGMEVDFSKGEIATFTSIPNAIEVIGNILEKDTWKVQAQKARASFTSAHTWKHHFAPLLEHLK